MTDILRLGIGPGLYFAKAQRTSYLSYSFSSEEKRFNRTSLGLMVDTALTFPRRTQFFCVLNLQYRKVGQVDMGPFTAGLFPPGAILPQTKVDFDNNMLSLSQKGLGLTCPGTGYQKF